MNRRRPRRIAFLLAQLGSDASAAFEQALAPLGITPSEAGMLRLIGRNPGISQKAVSEQLGVVPSRVVAVLDRLERQGHVERRRSATDRRSHEVHLTATGERLLAALDNLGRRDITSLLLEGGLRLAAAFAAVGEIDETRLFVAPVLLGEARLKPEAKGKIADASAEGSEVEMVGEDVLIRARLREW